eukprot:11217921-Lingulodinium_polyedra.AAC.1
MDITSPRSPQRAGISASTAALPWVASWPLPRTPARKPVARRCPDVGLGPFRPELDAPLDAAGCVGGA